MATLGPPLDYSFRNLSSVEELQRRGPRRGVRRYRRSPGGLYRCVALRLNNNQLASVRGLHHAVFQVLEQPERLTWLDLSFNMLSTVSSELASFSNLKILYLHGNLLKDFTHTLEVLKALSDLYNLTLHGNPIESKKGYRSKVLASLNKLRSLDFINVTQAERERYVQTKKER
ncbi:hypothetical protein R5R35_001659 [Gryllus longicercus]|uniref:Leucine-rich repeat-containing protein 51 n=1 Tax=Gryllus longicercus TaxID=2509291 RepID=A0AAN9VZB3_9ORTH